MDAKQDKQATAEQSFRASLEDVVLIVEKLGPLCSNFEEFLDLIRPALNNDPTLRLLMQQVAQKR